MPSPLGHALGGVIACAAVVRRPTRAFLGTCAVVAALPDVDILLPIAHRGATHSITAAIAAFAVTFLLVSRRHARGDCLAIATAVGLAVLSHVLFDWLGEDSTAPRGLMALWPFSNVYYVSDWNVFASMDRRYWLPGFFRKNAIGIVRELLILLPVAFLVAWKRRIFETKP